MLADPIVCMNRSSQVLCFSGRSSSETMMSNEAIKCRPVWTRGSRAGARFFFFFSSRRRHTRLVSDWSSDVCSSDLNLRLAFATNLRRLRSEGGLSQQKLAIAAGLNRSHLSRLENGMNDPRLAIEIGRGSGREKG